MVKVKLNDQRPRKSTVALYSDDLRYSIIQEVFKQPALWDIVNREPASVVQRKEIFQQISQNLKSFDKSLTASVVEKQWKNLKDTYNKVKKKSDFDENGKIVFPKWRFFKAMVFIDPNLSNLKPHNQATTSDFKSDINCVLGLKKLKPCFSGSESSIHNQSCLTNSLNSNAKKSNFLNVNINNKSPIKTTDIKERILFNTLIEDDIDDNFWGIWYR